MTTGPKTVDGKDRSSQNARKHGFYSPGLTSKEKAVYENQSDEAAVSLLPEIKLLKAKVLVYLADWKEKLEQDGEAATQVAYKVITETEDGERVSNIAGYYRAATIEDRPLMRALNDLGRMVERQARLNPEAGDDLVSQINAELRAASHGQVTVSWANRQAQSKVTPRE